jgi:glycine/D-amino acid oxidase-like deaminating enzyme
MSVAVLGGGFQGCCAAIELAMRGAQVTLYERNSTLLAGAATANEVPKAILSDLTRQGTYARDHGRIRKRSRFIKVMATCEKERNFFMHSFA